MYRSNLLATLAALWLATGCIGQLDTGDPIGDDDDDTPAGPDAGGGNEGTAEAMFNATVKPLMGRCSSCHAGTATYPLMFLGAGPADGYYASIIARPEVTGGFEPAIASLIHKLDGGTHQGLAEWSAGEEQSISEWLLAEKEARGGDIDDGGDDPLPTDSKAALAQWSGCMTKANWDTAQMGSWSDKPAEGGTVCSSCHNDGLQRFNANADNDTMFEMNRYEVFIISFFTVRVNLDNTTTVIPAYDKLQRMGNGSTLHPTYNMALDDTYFARLQNFYDLTMETKTQGLCGPAEFPQP